MYNYTGKLSYEGEFLNEKKHGKGKDYSLFGTLEYEGEFENGSKTGVGIRYNILEGLI